MKKKKEKNTEVSFTVEFHSLDGLLNEPEVGMKLIEQAYARAIYRGRDKWEKRKMNLTITLSGPPSDTPAEEIFASFREAYANHYSKKYERSCLNTRWGEAMKRAFYYDTTDFYHSLVDATLIMKEVTIRYIE